MAASNYAQKIFKIKADGGPLTIKIQLSEFNDTAMQFTSDCRWRFFPSLDDEDNAQKTDLISLDSAKALIDLGERAAVFNFSRFDFAVVTAALVDGAYQYRSTFTVLQNGTEVKSWTRLRKSTETVDVYTGSFLFVHN